ncbi:uncharacterized lipoprotein YehR (DUF1307 family) [Paenibacillus sp. 1182]|uniref:hypothetical protein n=1 Tax=Paenibacillus sp. 1182 TaxID=2806565 RepID=UPI001AE3A4C6|nr:hypothetical protein [Paenibacillus sp. 1182]MBP1309109.1 uncharacterized lipoprotein YehR (DUF1307 family) [Paenibacillus sp. 1182]
MCSKLKSLIICITLSLLTFALSGCTPEVVPVDVTVPVMKKLSGDKMTFTHELNGNTITTSYDLGGYKLENWRITDSKSINISVGVKKKNTGSEILVEHVHADVSIKSTDPQLNGLTQDTMDNSYHGTSQDGFFINEKYSYANIFAIEGFSKDIIDGWMFYQGDYGNGQMLTKRLTENTLLESGTYGSQITVVYNLLVKNPGDDKYHIESLEDRILIPTAAVIQASKEQEASEHAKTKTQN